MNKYTIDYEYGVARLYTPSEDWENRFYDLASQCFGIRKSIGKVKLIEKEKEQPYDKIYFEYERLEHSGDTIIWNDKGKKIKTNGMGLIEITNRFNTHQTNANDSRCKL